jgi:hypothetical protein
VPGAETVTIHALPVGGAEAVARAIADRVAPKAAILRQAPAGDGRQAQGPLCILYEAPESVLAAALRDGGDAHELLTTWVAAARDALALHRRDRARSMVIEIGHLLRFADVGLARMGIHEGSEALRRAAPPREDPGAVPRAVAKALLQEAPVAQALAEELAASAQALSNTRETVRTAEIRAELTGLYERADRARALRDELDCARAEAEAARQAHEAREAEHARDKARLDEQTEAMTADIARLEVELSRQQAEARRADARSAAQAEAMTADLAKLEAELSRQRDQAHRANARAAEAAEKAQQASAEIARLEAALAAREGDLAGITAERDARGNEVARLRAERRRLGEEAEKRARAMAEDMARLETTLAMREATLAAREAETTRAKGERQRAEARAVKIAADKDAEIKRLGARLAKRDGDLRRRSAEAAKLRAEVERIMSSRSVRATAPLRRVFHLLRRRRHGRRRDD